MNRLKNSIAYLAGPMDNCPNGGENWRNEIIPFLSSLKIKVFNPANKPINIGREDKDIRKEINRLKELGEFDRIRELVRPIRTVDLRMVDLSNFLIMNIDHGISSCGTHEEWVTANRQKKPIIVRCEQGKSAIPNWMFGAIPHELFFSTWQEVTNYLKYIDSHYDSKSFSSRWVFFDYEKMHNPITS